jgi:hypothetical protein
MCDYQGHEFGATYPDSVCIDGSLWDADSGDATDDGGWEYTNGGDIPCPECNHAEWLNRQQEDLEERGWVAADEGLPNAPPFSAGTLRYPEDLETLTGWWLKGYDQRKNELAQVEA